MRTAKEIKEELKPLGKLTLSNMNDNIKRLTGILEEEETIKSFADGSVKMNNTLIILTDHRLIFTNTTGFKKDVQDYIYEIKIMEEVNVGRDKIAKASLRFRYIDDQVEMKVVLDKQGNEFIKCITELFGINDQKNQEPDFNSETEVQKTEKIKTRGLPKTNIEILSGSEQLGYKKSIFNNYQIVQLEPGEIRLRVNYEWTDKEFYFMKYERTENIRKSALDVAGWTFAGNMLWGKAGALAGGLGAQSGKDKSTAALFLVDKDTKEKIMLVIKCDSKVLEKLSLFIPSDKDFDKDKENKTVSDKYEQLERAAKLKVQGILTEDEFQQEKTKILNS